MNTSNSSTIEKIRGSLKIWNFHFKLFNILTFIMGSITIITSVIVSVYTATTFLSPAVLKVLSSISTISLTLFASFNLTGIGNNRRKAWLSVNASLMRYENGIITIEDLIDDYQEGERILGIIDFNFGKTSNTTD